MAVKTAGIASYFEDFFRHGSREGGLKLRCIKCEVIFARTLRMKYDWILVNAAARTIRPASSKL